MLTPGEKSPQPGFLFRTRVSQRDSNPRPSGPLDRQLNAFTNSAIPAPVLVGNGLRPEDTQDSSELVCVECGEFVKVTLSHLPPL